MRLAVVGWGGDSGVGRELIGAIQNLPVQCAFILENKVKGTRRDLLKDTPCFFSHPERGTMQRQMELFLEAHRPDTILTWEVPGDWGFPSIWKANKIRWNHVVHWDWFDGAGHRRNIWQMANLISPNIMCQKNLRGQFSLDSTVLPVPIDTDHFMFRLRDRARSFVSIYGYGGAHHRRSIPELMSAWRRLNGVPLTILAQAKPDELKKESPPPSVDVNVFNLEDPRDLYTRGDVAVQPSRYEGVGVSLLEAQACGMPVVAMDAPPMNEILLQDLLVPVAQVKPVPLMSKVVKTYVPDPEGIVKVVKKIVGSDISEMSARARESVEIRFSWHVLQERWVSFLGRGR